MPKFRKIGYPHPIILAAWLRIELSIDMSNTIQCPNCNHENIASESYCANCGISLALAAVLAENKIAKQIPEPENLPLSPEILVPRLGDYLVEQGLLRKEQLDASLKYQKEESQQGNYTLLGRILVDKGFIDQNALDTAITEQIVLLQDALKKSNSELEQRVEIRTAELQQALQKITELNQLKTNFISNISHELRTPLAHMIGYLELLNDGALGPLDDEQLHAIQVLIKSYNRLHGLIDELIQFSMLSQGEMSLSQLPVSIDSLIDKTIAHVQNVAAERNLIFTLNKPKQEVKVLADQDKISWVIGEFLENSLKFNRDGGKVMLTIAVQPPVATFAVYDTGIGISPEQIDEIFEPFHQLDGSSTRRYGGTGIGLSLAKQIIEAHGSQIKVQSKVSRGSKFEFSLPLA